MGGDDLLGPLLGGEGSHHELFLESSPRLCAVMEEVEGHHGGSGSREDAERTARNDGAQSCAENLPHFFLLVKTAFLQ